MRRFVVSLLIRPVQTSGQPTGSHRSRKLVKAVALSAIKSIAATLAIPVRTAACCTSAAAERKALVRPSALLIKEEAQNEPCSPQ
jgi:hypothetical protein